MAPPTTPGRRALSTGRGFTYIGLLIFIAVSSAAIAATLQVWHTARQREKEAELLFIGNEFRNALKGYYFGAATNVVGQAVPVGQRPKRLEDLVQDPRFLSTQRWLRKIYVDPMTGRDEWGFVTMADGGISGVYSLSGQEPLKKKGFLDRDTDFQDKTKYSEWVFTFKPTQAPAKSTQPAPSTIPPRTRGGRR